MIFHSEEKLVLSIDYTHREKRIREMLQLKRKENLKSPLNEANCCRNDMKADRCCVGTPAASSSTVAAVEVDSSTDADLPDFDLLLISC